MSFKGHDRTMPQIGSIFCDCHQAFGIKIKGLKFLPILASDPPLSLSSLNKNALDPIQSFKNHFQK